MKPARRIREVNACPHCGSELSLEFDGVYWCPSCPYTWDPETGEVYLDGSDGEELEQAIKTERDWEDAFRRPRAPVDLSSVADAIAESEEAD